MSEAAYPPPVNISRESIEKLSVAGDIEFIQSDVEDMRPTQEYRDAVNTVIKSRQLDPTLKVKPLSEHIDIALSNRNIRR